MMARVAWGFTQWGIQSALQWQTTNDQANTGLNPAFWWKACGTPWPG